MTSTPSQNKALDRVYSDFSSLTQALDYASKGETGVNFYSPKAELERSFSYAQIRGRAIKQARQLLSFNLDRLERIGLIADMSEDFITLFLACQYAGLLAVPLPIVTGLGGRHEYESQLARVMRSSGVKLALGPTNALVSLQKAAQGLDLLFIGDALELESATLNKLDANLELSPLSQNEPSHIQFSSGSTRHPLGILISQKSLMANAKSVAQSGLCFTSTDRVASWLPFYHDMGLIGFFLIPLTSQMSIDYLHTDSFARRPLSWLKMISDNQTTITFSPTFGYEICARRIARRSPGDIDLSCLRVAGIGGEMVQPEVLENFARAFAPYGFDPRAFVPSYGMAEATLAISFSKLGEGVREDLVIRQSLIHEGEALTSKSKEQDATSKEEETGADETDLRRLARCGKPLPGYQLKICNTKGNELAERQVGHIHIKGPSLMSGYDRNLQATRDVMDSKGWLHTGDMGYLADGELVITGRHKDLIIVNGRNIWPQDLEWHVEENIDSIRSRSTAAFSIEDKTGHEQAFVLVQTRCSSSQDYQKLKHRVKSIIFRNSGIDCKVVLIPPGSLPFTTSGKLSRSKAKKDFLSGVYAILDQDEDIAGSSSGRVAGAEV